MRRARSDRIVAGALALAALLAGVLAASAVRQEFVIPLMAAIGVLTGTATPRFGYAAYGRIYGFVYAGLDIGFALAPLLFGGLMNRGQYTAVLAGVATIQGLSILTAIQLGRTSATPIGCLAAGDCAES